MIDLKVVGKYPEADFDVGRKNALGRVGCTALKALRDATPIQKSSRGGHKRGTGRDAMRVRRMGKGTAIKVGIFGKSKGYFLRFVEHGHRNVKVNSYERRRYRNGKYYAPDYAKVDRRGGVQRGWKKVRTVIGTVPKHPFFFPAITRVAPKLGDDVVTELEQAVTFEEMRS